MPSACPGRVSQAARQPPAGRGSQAGRHAHPSAPPASQGLAGQLCLPQSDHGTPPSSPTRVPGFGFGGSKEGPLNTWVGWGGFRWARGQPGPEQHGQAGVPWAKSQASHTSTHGQMYTIQMCMMHTRAHTHTHACRVNRLQSPAHCTAGCPSLLGRTAVWAVLAWALQCGLAHSTDSVGCVQTCLWEREVGLGSWALGLPCRPCSNVWSPVWGWAVSGPLWQALWRLLPPPWSDLPQSCS